MWRRKNCRRKQLRWRRLCRRRRPPSSSRSPRSTGPAGVWVVVGGVVMGVVEVMVVWGPFVGVGGCGGGVGRVEGVRGMRRVDNARGGCGGRGVGQGEDGVHDWNSCARVADNVGRRGGAMGGGG
jgi:hypothetical protein